MSRRARFAVPIVLVLVLVLGWTVWPRGPALVLYTSPPITLDKKTFRLQALVPAGWRAARAFTRTPMGFKAPGGAAPATLHCLLVSPPERPCKWMPEWLKRRLFGPRDRAAVFLNIWEPDLSRREDYALETRSWDGNLTASRSLPARMSVGFDISYFQTNRPAFESTYRQICESFRVIE